MGELSWIQTKKKCFIFETNPRNNVCFSTYKYISDVTSEFSPQTSNHNSVKFIVSLLVSPVCYVKVEIFVV